MKRVWQWLREPVDLDPIQFFAIFFGAPVLLGSLLAVALQVFR